MTSVVVWSTGWIGQIAIGAIHERADLELAGVWVHSPDKVGRDVGELAGIGPIGVTASGDADALLALNPDCVLYAASGPERDLAAVPDYVRILQAGVDVVAVSTPSLIYPPAYVPEWRDELAAAAAAGGATFYASGIEPGFAADHLPLTLATQSRRIRSISCSEIFLYHEYPVAFMMRDVMGFGMPLDFDAILAAPGSQALAWGPSIHLVADALETEVDDIVERYDRVPTPRTLEVASGVIEAGTCGAVRIQTVGIVGGVEAITVEHVNRMAPDLAPEWSPGRTDGTYQVTIVGEPDISCTMTVGDPDSPTEGGMVATAMRVVNAIPHVVAAQPGLISSLDLPLTLPPSPFG
jgi:2,4-diaminopentanoate dehydrogenase